MRWSAQEKGWINEWRELKAIANAANTTQLGSAALFGTLDYATNCNPDVDQIKPDEEVGRAGLNDATYPAAKFPGIKAGFGI
jgi:hypothetical protein